MNSITLLNIALHTLLLSMAGWMLVRGCLRDPRHRACAALVTLTVAAAIPGWLNRPAPPLPQPPSTFPAVTAWKPDWKMHVTLSAIPEDVPLPTSVAPPRPTQSWHALSWPQSLTLIWGVVAAVALAAHLRQTVMKLTRLRSLRAPTPEELALIPISAALPRLRIFPGHGTPCVIGCLPPTLVLPAAAFDEFEPRQWQWTLHHEQEHLRAHDPLIAWLLGCQKALLWWNPFVHGLIDCWLQAREEVCDAAALAEKQDAPDYAAFLVQIAGTANATLSMAASRPARRLRTRIQAVLSGRTIRQRIGYPFGLGCTAATLLAVLVAGCTGFKDDAHQPGPVTPAAPDQPENLEIRTRTFRASNDFVNQPSAKALLIQHGVPFPEGTSAIFAPGTGQLIVRNTPANLLHTGKVLRMLAREQTKKSLQVYVTTKWVEMDESFTLEAGPKQIFRSGSIFTDPQFQIVIRELSRRPGVDMMSAPSVTALLEQKAIVEATSDIQPAAGSATPDFVGPYLEITPHLADDKLKLTVIADLGFLEGRTLAEAFTLLEKAYIEESRALLENGLDAATFSPVKAYFKIPQGETLRHLRRRKTAVLENSSTLALSLGSRAPGRQIVVFVTAKIIDPTG